MSEIAAAFDFDGTLTTRDTLLPFLVRVVGRAKVSRVLAANAGAIARASRRRASRDLVKERILASCLAGRDVDAVSEAALRYVPTIAVRHDVVAKLHAHQEDGHRIVVVSASPTIYVAPAVLRLGVTDVLATDLEVVEGVITGRLATKNCRAEEKVVRLDAWLAGRDVELHAYGNSPDDAPMLARAHHAVWV